MVILYSVNAKTKQNKTKEIIVLAAWKIKQNSVQFSSVFYSWTVQRRATIFSSFPQKHAKIKKEHDSKMLPYLVRMIFPI